ncbi:MAG: CHC2 zinc finger domain-containing protein [Acidimicrobiales bacterium]
MARIPDDELARLKAEVSIVRLVEAAGIELRRHGADLVGLCPFHDDHEPSLVISPKKNLWHCLGACSAGGSVVDWVMRAEGVSFRHAVELLRDGRAGDSVSDGPLPVRSSVTKLPSPLDRSVEDRELLGQVVAFYHQALLESPDALGYLQARRVDHPDALSTFRLGFANRTLGYRLPNKQRREGAEMRARLQRLGVLRESGHEHFNGSVVVPVFDEHGRVAEIYGRRLKVDARTGTPAHLYLPGPHAGVWNIEAVAASPELIVCESLLDALSLWCAGFRHVTAAYGTEGFTADHLAALRTHQTKRVLIAYDGDDAGDKAAKKLAGTLLGAGIECFRVELPKGADINDVARDASSPTETLGRLIRKASWMGAGPGPTDRRHAPPIETLPLDPEPVPSFVAEQPPPGPAGPVEPDSVSPAPALPADVAPVLGAGGEVTVLLGDRRWRVRGLERVTSFDLLRLNVLVSRPDERHGQVFHVDTLDLYSARARVVFAKAAAEELSLSEEVIKRDLGRVLLACETLADEAITAAQTPTTTRVELTEDDRAAALELLRSPDLIGRIAADFATTGVVGEATNCLVGYLAAVSRKLDTPLAVIVQSTSAAGKSALMEAVLAMVPAEERIKFSAMTGQSLFYMGEADLAHKVLAIAEEEGAERAAYALKLLQSEGELSIASTGKDNASGRLVTHTYSVVGPVAIMLTTTAIDVDEELLNRCVVLTVDEDRDQTRAIHDRQRQRQTLPGLLADQERARTLKVHQDAQRLLEPVLVVNPFAERLTFNDGRTRTRRDHVKYLTLIRTIALLHQHQRERRTATTPEGRRIAFIEVTPADIVLANRLAHEVLGRSLDELPPQTRRLLDLLDGIVATAAADKAMDRGQVRLTRRELRETTGWSDTALKVHLARLVDLELVLAHRPEPGGCFRYELAWDGAGRTGERFLIGLTDPTELAATHGYDEARSGPDGSRSAPGQGPVSPRSGAGPAVTATTNPQANDHKPGADGVDTPEGAVPDLDDEPVVVTATARRAG